MSSDKEGWLDRTIQTGALTRWTRLAAQAEKTALPDLRRNRNRARKLKQHIDQLIHVADSRLALPLIGNQSFPRPADADWAWRPELWCGPLPQPGMSSVPSKSMLGQEVTLFHDCARSEITLRQLRNLQKSDLAAYGLRMDVFRFDGSYLSLAVDLPKSACEGVARQHLIGLSCIVEMEKKIEIFSRLNIKNGPNTEQIVRELPLGDDEVTVDFDLNYTKINEQRVEKMWLDLIFEGPQMNQIVLRDLTLHRRQRAQL